MKLILKIKYVVLATIGFILLLLFLGSEIGSITAVPDDAIVYVDDSTKTILAPECVRDWQTVPNAPWGIIRRMTMGQASKLNYDLDPKCRDTGEFAPDGPTLTEMLLIKLRLWPKPTYWWDMPYETDNGKPP